MPYIGKKPADIIATAVDTTTGTFSGDIDVDGVTNLDVVDIDGALTQDGGAVFNEASADVDFRVESNTLTHALFVDGANGYVGIGGLTAPSAPLHILDNAGAVSGATYRSATPLVLENNANTELQFFSNSSNNAQIRFGDGDSNFAGAIEYSHSDNSARIWTNSAEQVRIHSNGVLSAADGIALGVGTANTSSNVLDDYEGGTYQPTVVGSTSGSYATGDSATYLMYTKVGRMVHVQGNINVVSGSLAGTVRMSLPFATGDSTDLIERGYGTVLFGVPSGTGVTFPDDTIQCNIAVPTSASYMTFRCTIAGANIQDLSNTHIPNNTRFNISLTYQVFV